jgi:hypothetical protein
LKQSTAGVQNLHRIANCLRDRHAQFGTLGASAGSRWHDFADWPIAVHKISWPERMARSVLEIYYRKQPSLCKASKKVFHKKVFEGADIGHGADFFGAD